MHPLEDRLVIRMLQPDEDITTAAGIIIPEGAHERTMFGVVVRRGRGRRTYGGNIAGTECSVNDIVLVGKLAGTEFVSGGKKYTVIREADVMVRWEGAGSAVHLSDEKEATGVDEFLPQRQLPAKVDSSGFYEVKAGAEIRFNDTAYHALRDVFVRERGGQLYHMVDSGEEEWPKEMPGPGPDLVTIESPAHPKHPDHTLPRAAKGHVDENRDKLPRAADEPAGDAG